MAKRLTVLMGMLALMLAAAVPAMAQEGQYGSQPDPMPSGERVTVTGTLEILGSEDPYYVYGLTDEASGQGYKLDLGYTMPEAGDPSVGSFVGERIAVDGVAYPNPDPDGLDILEVLSFAPVDPPADTVTATFELTVECELPEGLDGFGADIGSSPIASGALLDQDGDGVYTTSLPVEKGAEHEVRIERIDLVNDEVGVGSTLEDFGSVVFDEDRIFEASVSFCDGGGSDDDDGDAAGDGTPAVSGDTNDANTRGGNGSVDASGGAVQGGASPAVSVLPATGGILPVAAAAGTLLILGGLAARRIFR